MVSGLLSSSPTASGEPAVHDRSLFTSESVTEGHPDKVADAISDAVLDCLLEKDPAARVACETLVTTGIAVIAGEITTSAYVHLPDVVRDTIKKIGYTKNDAGFDADSCAVMSTIDRQSRDIGQMHVRLRGDLTGDDGEARGNERLTCHARGRIRSEETIENGVRDGIRDLVGMSFGYGFGRKETAIMHGGFPTANRRGRKKARHHAAGPTVVVGRRHC